MDSLILLVVIGTTIWVAYDTEKIGVKAGQLGGGFLDMVDGAGFLIACSCGFLLSQLI